LFRHFNHPSTTPAAILKDSALWMRALAAAVLMQTLCAFLTRVFPVMGPALTEAASVPPETIGYLAALNSLGTLWYLVAGGDLLTKLGPLRSMQVGAVVGLVGLLLALAGDWSALMLASVLIGFGYGSTPAAGSEVLNEYAPARHRSLVFSIKQSGVPLGGVMAGLLVPAVLAAVGWRLTCVACALVVFAMTILVDPLHPSIDRHRNRGLRLRLSRLVDPRMVRTPFRSLSRNRPLQLVTAASICFAIVQGCVLAFFVTYLMVELRFSLVAAGVAFSVMQVTGVVGRVAAGWSADRLGSRRAVLIGLAVASSLATAFTATLTPSSPLWAIQVLAGIAGVASTSWNGVFLAEVSQLAPAGKVGDATAGATFFTFIGYVVGPAAFGALLTYGGSYQSAFAILAAVPLGGIIALGLAARR
jgi:MFS family permease